MPEAPLKLTVQTVTKERLTISVENPNQTALDKVLTIELFPPAYLLDDRIIAASRKARDSESPRGAASLGGVVSGPTSWSVWAKADMSEAGVPIMLRNDRSQENKRLTPPIAVAAGAVFTIEIPLDPAASLTNVEFNYACTHNGEACGSGTLKLKSDTSTWDPQVTLKSNQPNPTMIDAREEVKISWEIKDGVTATLRGPLPSGNAEWVLSDSEKADYKLSGGTFIIRAVGPVTYLLQAEVKGPEGKPNVQVVRVLSLDIKSPRKYGYLTVHPDRILPYGPIVIDWAAWDVDPVIIDTGSTSYRFRLTDMTRSDSRQGIGIVRSDAGAPDPGKEATDKNVYLRAEVGEVFQGVPAGYSVMAWRKMAKSTFTGEPVGLAIAADGKMALLTSDGLWIARVGVDDQGYSKVTLVDFSRPTTPADRPVTWRAIAALGSKFVVLRQTAQDVMQLALYSSAGTLEGAPIDLPNEVRQLLKFAVTFDLAVYDNRVYVGLETSSPRSGQPRRVFSVSFDKTPAIRSEPLLEHLFGYRLQTFDEMLYALNRESGRLFRFATNAAGKLEPYEAAKAVDKGSSMVTQGMLVPVGRVLAVLNPTSVPSQSSLASFGLRNVLRYQTKGLLKAPGSNQLDLAYDSTQNRWTPCGRAMEIKSGMVCGFRGGTSPRLWMIEPNGDTHTLTVGSEHLFAHHYVSKLPMFDLDPYFDTTRKFTIVNSTGMQFVPLNETSFKAGLTAFSATGPVELSPAVVNLGPNSKAEFELRYNKADSPSSTLRFLMKRPDGIRNEYFLEVTISGPDLSTATSVFKRIAAVGSIAEVPGTRKQYPTTGPIEFVATPLLNGISLYVANQTPYQLWLRSFDGTERAYNQDEIRITCNSTPVSIYAHGAGELLFDVDFALPNGIRETSQNETQTTRIRVGNDKSAGLHIESPNYQETARGDSYACPIRYRLDRSLPAMYLNDALPGKDGESCYLAMLNPGNPNFAHLVKVDANTLGYREIVLDAMGVFELPNAIAVTADRVIGLLKDQWLDVYDYDLNKKPRGMMSMYDVVTNMKALRNDTRFHTLGMKQVSSNPPRYTYTYMKHTLTAYDPELSMGLDHLKGFRPARVPGAPAWVSPDTISPMDVNGDNIAICVEGGVIFINVKTKAVTEIQLDGTGREEAVLIDPTESLIFCAHNRMDNQGLAISRINSASPINRLTIHIPTTVAYMTEDTKTVVGPHLRYNRQRAVSMIALGDKLFVSHGTRIYVINKATLSIRTFATVDLPCRLIQVRPGKPPGENHPKYGAPPKDCFFVWAVGATYKGDGRSGNNYKTSLYKVAFVL